MYSNETERKGVDLDVWGSVEALRVAGVGEMMDRIYCMKNNNFQ